MSQYLPIMPSSMDRTEAIKRSGDANKNLAYAIGEFLGAAFPQAFQQGIAVGVRLEELLNLGLPQMLEDAERMKAMPMPAYAIGKPFDPMEYLADLCKQRDRLQDQMDRAEEMKEKAASTPMGDIMGLGIDAMLEQTRNQLEALNDQISNFQQQMEAREPRGA